MLMLMEYFFLVMKVWNSMNILHVGIQKSMTAHVRQRTKFMSFHYLFSLVFFSFIVIECLSMLVKWVLKY